MRFKLLFIFFYVSFFSFGQNTISDTEEIIQNVINQIFANNPTLALDSFEYQKYTKGIIKTQNKETAELIPSENDYFFEEAAILQFDQKQNLQKTILGSNYPGFETPYYPLFVTPFFPDSVYEKEFTIFEQPFYNPLSKIGLKNYSFELIETIIETSRPYHIIHFSPASRSTYSQLSGVFHIDTSSYAIQKASINFLKNKEVKIEYDFVYNEEKALWFPLKFTAEVTLMNNLETFYLFRKAITAGRLDFKKETSAVFYIESHFSEIKFSIDDSQLDPQIDVLANIEKNEENNSFWKRFRESGLSPIEIDIQNRGGQLIKEKGTEKRIERIEDFQMGFLELGFFDLDLKYLIKYNNYEGFRSGVGGITNERLFKRFNVGGYLVRGFKDEAFKYQVTTNFNLSKGNKTSVGFAYTSDVSELGTNEFLTDRRKFSLFEPRLINIIQFYEHQTWDLDFRHHINPTLYAEIQVSKSDISQTLSYQYLNKGTAFSEYNLTQSIFSVSWSPYGAFMKTPNEVVEYKMGYPRFSTQVTQSFKGVLDGDFNYTKIDARVDYLVNHMNQSSTEVILEGNLGFGDIPLTHLYHAFPNSPNKETILRRFSVAGIKSFETMYFGEFFSDKLATVHIKHHLNPFLIASWLKPEVVLITRHAIGTASNVENHQNINFKTLDKGYSESGIEINKLLFGFGASLAYRYGAYHLPKFEDNVSFKFTFNLKL
ncbi:MAG: DUF5686 family protein [Flavobacteriaceae bacterium]|nr:DUF5686 family protein [Flavobacteriaceae bacterium]